MSAFYRYQRPTGWGAMARMATCMALLLCTGCDDPKAAKRALEAMGLSHVETHGWTMWGCSNSDNFATRFSAQNAAGRRVTGVVCSGWLKGATVRFD